MTALSPLALLAAMLVLAVPAAAQTPTDPAPTDTPARNADRYNGHSHPAEAIAPQPQGRARQQNDEVDSLRQEVLKNAQQSGTSTTAPQPAQ